MWKTFIEVSKQLFTVVQETHKNKADIKEVREQLNDLTKAVERLAYEIHRLMRYTGSANTNSMSGS